MATILITGGTGLVGKRLTEMLLEKGHSVIIMSREKKASQQEHVFYAVWNVEKQVIDVDAVRKADYIIHLAGAAVVEKRWNDARKKEIVDSRTKSSALIVKALKENTNQVKAVISASAIGWYGADSLSPALSKREGVKGFHEEDKPATDFLGETCRLWEESIEPVTQLAKRLVKLRIGIVLAKEGGVLKEFMNPIKFGVAAILGSGKQMISWIHIDDLCSMFIKAMEDNNMRGSYNAVAPTPVSNKQLTLSLAEKMRGKFFIPVHAPTFALKIALGEMSIEVLKSTTVSSDKIKRAGYHFMYPALDDALNNLLGK
jgi:uncharacterized protein (TIGR01777 family)